MPWFFLALISALAVTGENIVEKGAVRRSNPALFATVAGILSGLAVIPFIFLVPWGSISLGVYLWLMLCAAVVAFAFFAAIKSMRHIQVSVSAPLFTLTPAVTALLGASLIGEMLRPSQWTGIALLVVGGYVLQMQKGQSLLYPLQRITQNGSFGYLFLSILLYPIGALMARYTFLHLGVEPYPYFVVTRLFGAAYFAVYLALWGGGLRQVTSQVGKYKGAYFWATFFSTVNSAFIILALAGAFAAQAVAVKRLSALFITIIGGGMYHEDHLLAKTFACIIMLIGALAVALT